MNLEPNNSTMFQILAMEHTNKSWRSLDVYLFPKFFRLLIIQFTCNSFIYIKIIFNFLACLIAR